MSDNSNSSRYEEVASPFCGIASDDLTIEVSGNTVTVVENGDAITKKGFETPITDTQPRINGEEVSLEQAIAKAADILDASQQPIIGGIASDINGIRAAMALADKAEATVDSMDSDSAFRNLLVLQDTGWMTTTLTEIRNRVDLLLVVGSDIEKDYPRFFERMVWNKESMFDQDILSREVIYLGKAPSGGASTSPQGKQAQVFACDDEDLPEVISVLRALVNGKAVQAETVGGIAIADLAAIAEKLKQAVYSVVVWASGSMTFDHAEASIQMLNEMIKELNVNTRCNGLPLGGKEGSTSVYNVSSWQSGYPMRTSFNRGFPDYDPYLYDSKVMLANGEADSLVWVSSFNVDRTPPKTDVPTIVVGRSGMTFEEEPNVFIPVGVPGIDHTGRTFRGDSSVAVPLRKLRDSGLPSTFEVLSAIEAAVTWSPK
jgi:formylmethanofuran dehydrogenase subunit B